MKSQTQPIARHGRLALAGDVGGTVMKVALIDEAGTLLFVDRIPIPADRSPASIVQVLVDGWRRAHATASVELDEVAGFGISIAAFILADGTITMPAHLAPAHLASDWIGYDLRAALTRELGPATYRFALDVPAPALGELHFGAARDVDDFAYVTVSTGIGAAIVTEGRLFTGGRGWAGGIGHSIIDVNSDRICVVCHNAGCLETYAATQGILRTAHELAEADRTSAIWKFVNGDLQRLTPEIVHRAAAADDKTAREVFRRAGAALGVGLTNLINVVAPKRVVIGGGIAQAGEILLEPARTAVKTSAFPPELRETEIVPAALGDLSGVYGAAAMILFDVIA